MESSRNHVVQSEEWGGVKRKYGTQVVRVGEIQFTKHSVPFTPYFYGYCPKVNPEKIDWHELRKAAKENKCFVVNFDCPNVVSGDTESERLEEPLKKHCLVAPKDTFAKANIILDISGSEEELLSGMHPKTRYNISYAKRNGIEVGEGEEGDLETFFKLLEATARRQRFFIHDQNYYQSIWEIFHKAGMVRILVARHRGSPISAWMFFSYEGTLYYPYGGWTGEYQNLFPNNLICWEGIRLGKRLGCNTFDMWGAATNPNDESDPYHGFTKFKLGYGGKHVVYINSYDYVLDFAPYHSFNIANKIRWWLLRALR